MLHAQLDFSVEAKNLARFCKHFPGDKGVRFPTPVLQLSSSEVLVESFECGTSLSTILNSEPDKGAKGWTPSRRREIARQGATTFFEMVLLHNFVHADLHPGNILVSGDGSSDSSETRISFIDAGLGTTLSRRDRMNFIDLFSAVLCGDGKKAAGLMVERSPLQGSVLRKEEFEKEMGALIHSVVKVTNFRLAEVRIGDVLRQVLTLCQRHHVKVDGAMARIISSIAILDGIGRQLDPDLDLFAVAKPILLRLHEMDPEIRRHAAVTVMQIAGRSSAK